MPLNLLNRFARHREADSATATATMDTDGGGDTRPLTTSSRTLSMGNTNNDDNGGNISNSNSNSSGNAAFTTAVTNAIRNISSFGHHRPLLDRAEEESKYELAEKSGILKISKVRFYLDSDNDFTVVIQGGEFPSRQYVVCVALEDPASITHTECKCIRTALQLCERGTDLNEEDFKAVWKKKFDGISVVARADEDTAQNAVFLNVKPTPVDRTKYDDLPGIIRKTRLEMEEDSGNLVVAFQTNAGEDFQFIVRLTRMNDSFADRQTQAAADVLIVAEPYDKMDDAIFLQWCARLKRKYTNVRARFGEVVWAKEKTKEEQEMEKEKKEKGKEAIKNKHVATRKDDDEKMDLEPPRRCREFWLLPTTLAAPAARTQTSAAATASANNNEDNDTDDEEDKKEEEKASEGKMEEVEEKTKEAQEGADAQDKETSNNNETAENKDDMKEKESKEQKEADNENRDGEEKANEEEQKNGDDDEDDNDDDEEADEYSLPEVTETPPQWSDETAIRIIRSIADDPLLIGRIVGASLSPAVAERMDAAAKARKRQGPLRRAEGEELPVCHGTCGDGRLVDSNPYYQCVECFVTEEGGTRVPYTLCQTCYDKDVETLQHEANHAMRRIFVEEAPPEEETKSKEDTSVVLV